MDNPVEKDPPRGPCYEYQVDNISAEELYERIDATPNDDLEDLIEAWRASANRADGNENYGYAFGREDCADELEELL